MPGDVDNHVCSEYYISEYDETNHWNRCKICDKEYDKVAHSLKDNGWSEGSASNCNESNVHKFSCDCGYSISNTTGRSEHSWNYTTTDFVRKRNGRTCNVCSKIEDHQCTGSDGIPFTCRTTGVCSICGYNWTYTGGHIWCANPTNGISHEELDGYIGDVRCLSCNDIFVTINYNYIERVDENTFKYYTSVTAPGLSRYYYIKADYTNFGDVATFTEEPKVEGNTFSNVTTITFNKHFEGKGFVRIGYCLKNGTAVNSWITPTKYNIVLDEEAPIITSINQNENAPWEKKKEITISGTENYCTTVKVEILDGENVIYEGTALVTDNNWSITAIPEIEADEIGRNLIARVTDPLDNSSTQEFPIKKVDAYEPEPVEETIVIGGDWAREKYYTFNATDDGVGAVSIAFNDLSEYKLAGIDEEGTFRRAYRFIGDVYEPREAVVY